jgi:branched-chain amino acid transport system permease protein
MLAAMCASIAGVLVAPATLVSPNAFDAVLIFGFTAAVLGGLESPPGALIGGIVVGLVLSYVSGYAGSSVTTLGALVILVGVLMVRPNGLFPAPESRRV